MLTGVPAADLQTRVAALQEALAVQGAALALVRQAADLYYYTGTVVDGFLAVPAAGDPLLLVRRPQGQEVATPWRSAFYKDLKEASLLLARSGFASQGPVGLELDVIPVAFYNRLQDLVFPDRPLQDISPLIRRQRMVKSDYELQQLRQASAIVDQVHEQAPELLQPGVSELELSAALEYRLRVLGHQGLVRVRSWDLEVFYGHVLSGVAGLKAAYADTPSGGLGFSPAFPQGPSRKELAPGEPISIDLAACVNGYIVDMTRIYALGSLPEQAWEAWRVVEELYRLFEAEARPGVMVKKIYHAAWEHVRHRGLQDLFMGLGPDRVSFLGHGVGLELDEFPVITARFPWPLEENMVIAFEPKFFLPEVGMVGLEDTGRVTPRGIAWLTHSPREIKIIKE